MCLIEERHYRSFRHAIAQNVADDEERIDENIAGDRDVDGSCIVQLESRSVENALERVHRIDRQTDCNNGQYLHHQCKMRCRIKKLYSMLSALDARARQSKK